MTGIRFIPRSLHIALFLSCVLLSFCADVCAQVAGGTIVGAVTDSAGSAIPGATLSVRDTAKGETRTLTSNGDGFYTAPNLVPSRYQVTASAPSFAPRAADITVTVGENLVLNFSLKAGTVNQKIEVTDVTTSVELGSATISDVVNGETIRELPLNGRSWTDLATLQPGVAAVETQASYTQGAQRGNRGFGAQISISGGRPGQNNYRLDGISINDYSNSGPGSVIGVNLGVDAIQEFSVITSAASAEYGKTSAGVINSTTRSGTNEFHGSVYEFIRNSALDTRNYFDSTNIPPFKRNQFGASAGGPILRDRTFIFGDYEGIRQSLGTTNRIVVPSLNARAGILSSGNVSVDPAVSKYLGLYPTPNGGLIGSGDTGYYNFTAQQIVNENFFTARLDHKLGSHDSAFATYLFDNAPFTQPDAYNNVTQGSKTRRQVFVLEETHTFAPSFVNSVRFGLNRQAVANNDSVAAINPLAADTSLAVMPGRTAAGINIPGIDRMTGGVGASPTYYFNFTTFQGYDDAFLTRGTHALRFGIAFERFQNNLLAQSNPNGLFNYASLSKFLTNVPKSFQAGFASTLTPRNLRQILIGGYLQDDWRLRPNLTVNMGLRYEMSTVPTEVSGKLSTLRNLTDAQPHLGDPLFNNPTYRNFEPRLGLVWDPTGKGRTSIRAGGGLYDVLPLLYEFEILSALASPYFQIGATTNPVVRLGDSPTQVSTFLTSNPKSLGQTYVQPNPPRNYVGEWNVSVQQQLSNSVVATVGYIGSRGVHQPFRTEDANIVLPTSTPQGFLWPTPAGSGKQVNPNVGTIRALWWMSGSSYNALEAQLTAQLHHTLQVNSSYTFGRSIDDNSATIAGDAFGNSVPSLDWFDLHLSKGLSDFNISDIWVNSVVWEVPGPAHAPGLLGVASKGWELGGIYKFSSGLPFTPLVGGDPLGKNSSDPWDYPDRVPGCDLVNHNYRANGLLNYVNLSCFTEPSLNGSPAPTLRGNAGRNIIIGPRLSDLDFSLYKNTGIPQISERFNTQFRFEVYNILNHSNFGIPNNNNQQLYDGNYKTTGAAGVLSFPTVTSSRQLQFALKLTW